MGRGTRPDNDRPHSSRILKRLSYNDYVIGWICALPLEMTAARAMLDEEHELLPQREGDDNAYILGSIFGHNTVIACLPTGIYGTTSATAVGIAMRTTYPRSISMPLLVGVGGGVPSLKHDIRLGDVVVGVPSDNPAVVQYDRGKTKFDGSWEVKGQLDKPARVLLNAASKLRTAHDLGRRQYTSYIFTAIERYALYDYSYPGSELDNLYESSKEFDDIRMHIQRLLRPNHDPVVHYGTIGSGNQVVKHGPTRDDIARPFDIICFEMEAAGLMDWLPCLVVRGICDYCDAWKTKSFQKYSALAAAAYAKDLLSMIPASSTPCAKPDEIEEKEIKNIMQKRSSIMKALNFKEAESRRETVGKAHTRTCTWFLHHPNFNDWLHTRRTDKHNCLLWLKGKPGTGKTTLTKFILDEQESSEDWVSISFFFNARGHDLEKCTLGMYRSLTYQLFKRIPAMQSLLDRLSSDTVFNESRLSTIQALFKCAVKGLGYQKTSCFIDALDECSEQQIRDMVYFFEEVGETAISHHIPFRIFFCSRHYPNISTKLGRILILEDQDGHSQDIVRYVDTELEIGATSQAVQIKQQILERSAGSFLWVILTVKMLKTEYDRGRLHSLSRKLKEIPLELNQLFRDIVVRDSVASDKHTLPELLLCFQLILYTKQPMKCDEFYIAMLIDDESAEIYLEDLEAVTYPVIDNFILDCSKGLAELTYGTTPLVQFIHESVREFLSQPEALADLWPGFHKISGLESHLRLRDCYRRYINLKDFQSQSAVSKMDKGGRIYQFFLYAIFNVLYHAEIAEQLQSPQIAFLRQFPRIAVCMLNLYGTVFDAVKKLHPDLGFLGTLASLGLYKLLSVWLIHTNSSEIELQLLVAFLIRYDHVWITGKIIECYRKQNSAYKNASLDHLDILLQLSHDAVTSNDDVSYHASIYATITWLPNMYLSSNFKPALDFAAEMKRPAVLKLLLNGEILQPDVTLHSLQNLISGPPPMSRYFSRYGKS